MRTYKTDKPIDYMASLCHSRIKDGGDTNYHIFINSVKSIANILRSASLSPADVRIVCSQNAVSGLRNSSVLPIGFSIAKTTDEVKPLNFYTSTCFEGQDIYDKNGRAFIVSDKFLNHTKIDISTTLIQICGRIRDSEYKNEVIQIYATSPYKDISLAEFERSLNADIADAEHDAEQYNCLTPARRNKHLERIRKDGDKFLRVEDDRIVVDRNIANLEIVNYKVVNNIYSSQYRMNQALIDSGFVIDESAARKAPESKIAASAKRRSFKDVFEEYCKLKESPYHFSFQQDFMLERITYEKPLVKEAYDILGPDEVRKLKYKNLRRAIIAKGKQDDDIKIVRMLNLSVQQQRAIPVAIIKKELQKIYDTLGIRKTAKATDLEEWFETQKSTRRIDGKSTACITIVRPYIKL